MRLTGIVVHPVKSLRGCAVGAAAVDALGLAGDRRFLVVDGNGRFLTQRTWPRMALVRTELSDRALVLSAPGAGRVAVPTAVDGELPPLVRTVAIWKDEGLRAEDAGDRAAEWLADFLGVKCRLVRIGRDFSRTIPEARLPRDLAPVAEPGGPARPRIGFVDAYPFMVVSEASLADLNRRLAATGEARLPMDRFRPNLVVDGDAAYAEDRWRRIRIGRLTLRAAGPCQRCVVTTTDQSTAERGPEPLRTLAAYRREPGGDGAVLFGQNMVHETTAPRIAVGDPVEVLEA